MYVRGNELISLTFPSGLQTLIGDLFVSSGSLESIEASGLINLEIYGTLDIVNSSSLIDLDFPQLDPMHGSFFVYNNSALDVIDGFPLLSQIGGDLILLGTFDTVSLPSLTSVGGLISIKTTSSKFVCPSEIRAITVSPNNSLSAPATSLIFTQPHLMKLATAVAMR